MSLVSAKAPVFLVPAARAIEVSQVAVFPRRLHRGPDCRDRTSPSAESSFDLPVWQRPVAQEGYELANKPGQGRGRYAGVVRQTGCVPSAVVHGGAVSGGGQVQGQQVQGLAHTAQGGQVVMLFQQGQCGARVSGAGEDGCVRARQTCCMHAEAGVSDVRDRAESVLGVQALAVQGPVPQTPGLPRSQSERSSSPWDGRGHRANLAAQPPPFG